MTCRAEIEAVLSGRIKGRAEVDGDLFVHAAEGGHKGNIYSLRIKDPETGGERVVGPHGRAAEFEYYLRGISYGLDLANGRYAADEEVEA